MLNRCNQLFDEVHREHLGLISKITHSFALERPDREDLFQEILLAVWQALPLFREESKLSTYVYRVALSCAMNWKRAARRYQRKIEGFAQQLPDLAELADSPARERLEWLYAKIHQLPPVDRTLLLLQLEQRPYDEITAITGLSKSNIGIRLHRAKQQLVALTKEIKDEP